MRLLFGIDSLTPPRTGIGRYTAALLRQWLARPDLQVIGVRAGIGVDDRTELAALAGEGRSLQDWRGPCWKRVAACLPGIRTAWHGWRSWRGRRTLNRLGPGTIYHEPNYIPLPLDHPLVVTVHDLSHLRFPQFHPRDRVRWLERNLPRTLGRAQIVITVSEFSRREILHHFGLPEARVVTILPGLEDRFHPPAPEELRLRLQGLGLTPGGYVAGVGTLEPRKNLGRLIEAYAALPKALRQRFPLVLAGPRGWRTEGFWPRIEHLQRRGELRWLGYLRDADLPAFYAGAAAFAYVSLYEGFGLPVLEAMGCGAPVLTSQDSAMASWAGEGVMLVDPFDVDAMTQALQRLLEDRALAHALAGRGRKQAERFSWAKCARATVEVYEQMSEAYG